MDDDNALSFDPSFFGGAPVAPAPEQDTSTPIDAAVGDLATQATQRVSAGEDQAAVEADLMAKVGGLKKTKVEAPKEKVLSFDPSFFTTPPPAEPMGPPTALAGPAPTQSDQSIGDMPPDFGTGGGPLDTSQVAPALATVSHQISEAMPRSLAAGEAGLVQFGANVLPAIAGGMGNPAAGQFLAQAAEPYAQEAASVQQQVAGERAADKATGTSSPISRAAEAVVGGAYALPEYMAVPEAEGLGALNAVIKALPASYSAAKMKFAELQPQVGTVQALEASGLAGLVNLVAGSVPLGMSGPLAERVAGGAVVGGAAEEAGRAGQNAILSDRPELQQPFEPEALTQAAGLGGLTAGVLGSRGLSPHEEAAANVQRLARAVTSDNTETAADLIAQGQQLQQEISHAGEVPSIEGTVPGAGPVEGGIPEGGQARGPAPPAEVLPAEGQVGVPAPEVQQPADAVAPVVPDAQGAAGTAPAEATVRPAAPAEAVEPATLFARSDSAGVTAPAEIADAAQQWRDKGTDSPYFRRYFDGSKVVDAQDKPQVVYHGTGEDFNVFDNTKAGDATQHATSPLGHFFTEDPKLAKRYAENASESVPANERVVDAYLSIKKPYEMPLKEAQAIDTPQEAQAVRQRLQNEGYDGIRIPEAKSWIAFDSAQIKDTGNRGTFDTANPDIRFARTETPAPSDNLTRDQARNVLAQEWGSTALRKLEANGLNLVSRDEMAAHPATQKLTPEQRAGVTGFTPADKSSANIVHDAVTKTGLLNDTVHELVHANLDRILDPKTRNNLANAIVQRGKVNVEVAAALKKIPYSTPKENRKEEILAQTMGDLYSQPIGRKVFDAFKLGLNRIGVPLNYINAHEAAIRQIGIDNLRHFAEAPRREHEGATYTVAPPAAGVDKTPKPRIRLSADYIPITRTEDSTHVPRQEGGATGGRGVPAGDAGDRAASVRESGATTRPPAPSVGDAETTAGQPAVGRVDQAGVVPEPSQDAVGTKNAIQEAAQRARGVEPVVSDLRPNEKKVWDDALAKRADDPTLGYTLSRDLARNPRPVDSVTEAVLIQHTAELHNRYDDILQRIETAKQDGDDAAQVNAQLDRKQVENQLAETEKATREIGTEWSATGRMRQKLAERDYSMARQVLRLKAITGQDELPQALRDQIAAHVKTIQDNEKKLAAALAENEQLRADVKAPVPKRNPSLREKQALDTEFSQLARRAAQLSRPREAATAFARVEDPELATLIRRMARNRSDAGETDPQKVLDAVHDALGGNVPRRDIADTITNTVPYRKITRTELQQRYNDLKNALRDPAVKRDMLRQRQLQKQLADIRSRIQRKDFSPPPKREKPVYGEAVQHMQLAIAKAKNELNALAAKHDRMNDTFVGKALRTIIDAKIFNILLSGAVYKKLGWAAVTRNATQITEEALGTVLAKMPGLAKYAAASPRYGGRGFWASMAAFTKGLRDAPQRAWEDLQAGQNKWDVLHGHKNVSQEFTDFSGRIGDAIKTPGALNKTQEVTHALARTVGSTHAVIKEFVSEPEMNVARLQIGRYEREQLLKKGMTPDEIEDYMARESTAASVDGRAYEHALESKFQGRNFITDNVNSILTRMERMGGMPGKLIAFAAKQEYPIRGIPMNIAKELLTSYPFGALKAIGKMARFDNLPDNQKAAAADYIMKNLRKQGVGIIALALGGYLENQFGGVPSAEKKKPKIKPGEAELMGQNLGMEAMHGPLPELMQMGASMARVYRNEYGSNGYTAMLQSLAQVYPTLALHAVPYTDQPRRQINTYESAKKYEHRPGVDRIAGDMLRANLVPSAVQQYARATDPFQGFRNPRNITEDIKLGIPGYREDVPQQHSKR